jgi:hypothetical protein
MQSPDPDEGSSCLSRRNMILGGAAVVAAISLPKNRHGLQVLAFTAPGATLFPQYIGDVFIAFTEASCKFLKEVHAGDTLYPALEIVALRGRPTPYWQVPKHNG